MADGIGETLRKARIQRGVELAEVESATKIRASLLEAIEREEWDALPGDFYARAFIREYAHYLGLDGEILADEFAATRGAAEAPQAVPQIDPEIASRAGRAQRRFTAPRLLGGLGVLVLAAVGVVIVLTVSGGGSSRPPPPHEEPQTRAPASLPKRSSSPGTSLTLTATAEVWVCLLDARGKPLIAGQTLAAGAEEGPFRSTGFTMGLGNGGVQIKVEGHPAHFAPTASPIGFSVAADGTFTELAEGERPTCT